jgi:hypothetical protein
LRRSYLVPLHSTAGAAENRACILSLSPFHLCKSLGPATRADLSCVFLMQLLRRHIDLDVLLCGAVGRLGGRRQTYTILALPDNECVSIWIHCGRPVSTMHIGFENIIEDLLTMNFRLLILKRNHAKRIY